jgi:hypothetical protein
MPSRRTEFDPRAILAALERNYVDYVLIGGLAQVLRGGDHVTVSVDICPSFAAGNLERLSRAVADLAAKRLDGESLEVTDNALGDETVISLTTGAGALQVIGSPTGAPKGYVDLRRAATKEHLGQGIQPVVASVGDLARMAAALDRDRDIARLGQLRRIMELEADREQTLSTPTPPARQASRTSTPHRGRRATQ